MSEIIVYDDPDVVRPVHGMLVDETVRLRQNQLVQNLHKLKSTKSAPG
jgi:hypothetical protein